MQYLLHTSKDFIEKCAFHALNDQAYLIMSFSLSHSHFLIGIRSQIPLCDDPEKSSLVAARRRLLNISRWSLVLQSIC